MAIAALALSGSGLVAYGLTQQEMGPPPGPARGHVGHADASTHAGHSPSRTAARQEGAEYVRPVGDLMDRARPTRVRIPKLGVNGPVIDLGTQPNRRMEVPQNGSDTGWFTGSPTPGELGPSIVAAHVTWQGKRGVFFELGSMKPGQRIEVDRQDGSTAAFVVDEVGQYPKAKFPTEKVYGSVDRAELRLITCGGVYDGDTGHHLDNVVVFAHLVGQGDAAGGHAHH